MSAVSMRRPGQFIAADLGDDFGCVVRSDGAVFCWGSYTNGRLGTSATSDVTTLYYATEVTGFEGNAGSAATTVTAGAGHACALRDDGDVFCWGNNATAQVGLATSTSWTSTPNQVSPGARAVDVAAGADHTCALLVGGTVKCWGSDAQGQLGDSASGTSTPTPTTVTLAGTSTALSDVVQIAAGNQHTCALTASGAVYCWGRIVSGSSITAVQQATAVTGWSATPTQISAGHDFTCARLVNGTVACLGANGSGRAGVDPATTVVTTPTGVTGLATGDYATQVSCGLRHACAYTPSGRTYCWGENTSGELGRSSTSPSSDHGAVTVKISGSTDYVYGVAVMGGGQFTCLTNAHGLSCFGLGSNGRLGNGSTSSQSNPVLAYLPDSWYAVGFPPFQYWQSRGRFHHAGAEIEGGQCHFCAIADGMDPASGNHIQGVQCWGRNNNGQLGDNTTSDRDRPVWVSGLDASTIAIAAGGNTTCSLQRGGTVKCWGSNAHRQIADSAWPDFQVPQGTTSLINVTAITVGAQHVCALLANGTVNCWGSNAFGQLGFNSSNTGDFGTPQIVKNYNGSTYVDLTGVVEIAAGQYHTCARLATGRVRCWGDDTYLQSSGTGSGSVLAPTADTVYSTSTTIETAVSVSAGLSHSCAVFVNGTVWCWGSNASRQFGTGSPSPSQTSSAQQASGISDAVAVSGAFDTVCAVRADGTSMCWGKNTSGTVGNNTTTTANTPQSVIDTTGTSGTQLGGVVRLVSDCEASCALRSDGTVVCWGGNTYGQLGDNTNTAHYFPQFASMSL